MPPGGGFIPPLGGGGMGVSPQRGGCIPAKGWFPPQGGGFIAPLGHLEGGAHNPFGVILSPLFGDFIPPLGAGGGDSHPLGGGKTVHISVMG